MTRWQLRDYVIQRDHLEDFIAAWERGVRPLRRGFGFSVRAWSVPAESRFVWILGYDGPGTFAEADTAYYASAERAAMEPDPAQWIVENRTTWLTPVEKGAPA